MKIKNITDFVDFKITRLARVYPNEIEIKSLDDIWDGPLSGECEIFGQRKYFFCFSDNEIPDVRKYLITDLDEKQKNKKPC